MDVPGCSTLFKQAKAAQESGDLKTAYYEYSKALNLLARALGAKIKFKGPGVVDAVPEEFALLLQQTRETLSRLEAIVSQARTMPSSSSSASMSMLSSKPTSRPLLRSRPSSSPSVRSSSYLLKRDKTKKNIPLIPISPLTRLALEHNFNLTQVSHRLDQAKQEGARSPSVSGGRDLAQLRRLIEDVRIQRAKVDAVNTQIQSAAQKTLVDWDADVIARQLTIIDTALFKKVAIPKDLVRQDRKHWPAQACIDFDTYVTHSVAHVILQSWDMSRHPHSHHSADSISATHSKSSNLPSTPNVITHLIRVAYILLHVYRNFNSFMAIMRTLTSPEIKRAHSLWSGVPSKTKDLFRKLIPIVDERNHAQQYKETLRIKLDAFQDVGRDALVAIPWMRYHQEEVKSILHSYLTGHETRDGSTDVVLSAPGARKLSAVTALLNQCRNNEVNQDDLLHPLAALDHKTSKSSSNSGSSNGGSSSNKDVQQTAVKNREPVSVDGLRHALTPMVDLAALGNGDAQVHHWLLTRPYLDKQQLIDESLEIEPLANGEELPCVDRPYEEEDDESSVDDLYDDGGHAEDESFEHVIAPDLTGEPLAPLISTRPDTADQELHVTDEEVNAIMDELLADSDLDDGDAMLGDDNLGTGDKNQEQDQSTELPVLKKTRTPMSSDLIDFLGINPDDLSQSSSDDEDGGLGAHASARKDKGKARLQSQEEADDELFKRLHNLTLQSHTLIQESHKFQKELEDDILKGDVNPSSSQVEDFPSSTGSSPWLVKKFEPMTQGSEQDQLHIDDTGVQGKEMKDMTGEQVVDSSPHSNEPESSVVEQEFSSLDVLRRQLNQMHMASESPMARLESENTQEGSVQKDKLPSEAIKDSPSSNVHSDLTETPFPSRFVSSSNPFAQYIKPTSGDEPARNESVRTLRTKRSRVVLKPGESAEGTDHASATDTCPPVTSSTAGSFHNLIPPTTANLSPPKDIKAFSPPRLSESIPSPLLASDEERQAIQERARLSLASHSNMSKAASSDTAEKQTNLPVLTNLSAPVTLGTGMSDIRVDQAPLIDVTDTPEVKDTASTAAAAIVVDHQEETVELSNASPNNNKEHKGDDSATPQDSSSPLSPATSPEGARSPSRGRQRRRIAGGMVPLPTPSKALTLLSTPSNMPSSSSTIGTSSEVTMSAETVTFGDHLMIEDESKAKSGTGQEEKEREEATEEHKKGESEGGREGNSMTVTNESTPNNAVLQDEITTAATIALPESIVPSSPPSEGDQLMHDGGDGDKTGLLVHNLENNPADEALPQNSPDRTMHTTGVHVATAVSGISGKGVEGGGVGRGKGSREEKDDDHDT